MSALSAAIPAASSPDPVVSSRYVSSVLLGILAFTAINAAPVFALIGGALLVFIWPAFVSSWLVEEVAKKDVAASSSYIDSLTSAIVRPAALGLR